MELYLIRHGETLWNAENRLQGTVDIDLNEKGRLKAIELGNQLDCVDFERIYSSPLIRAYETACLVRGRKNLHIQRDERLREISFGEMEGHLYTEWIDEKCPFKYFFTNPELYTPPAKGESLESLCERTKAFVINELEPLYNPSTPEQKIMVIAHGALNKGIMCYLENNDKAHFWGDGLQQNCQATIFSFDGKIWTKKN